MMIDLLRAAKIVLVSLFLTFEIAMGQSSNTQLTLTLDESIDIALQRSKALAIARAKITEASSKVGQARAGLLPKLSSSFNYTRLDVAPFMPTSTFADLLGGLPISPGMPALPAKKITIGDYNNYSVTLSIQQPIFTGWRVQNAYKIAQYGAEAAETDYQKSRNNLIFDVEKAYWEVIKAQEFVKVAEDAVKQMQAHLQDLENMYQVGMVTENDLLRTKVQLSNAKLALIRATNGVKLAKTVFCSVIGISLDTKVILQGELGYEPGPEIALQESIQQALAKRPELQTMKANIKIAQKMVNINRVGYLPSIFLAANYAYRRPDREYNPEFYASWNISVLVQFNLFDWGESSFKTSEAQSHLIQLQEVNKQLEDGIILEVTQSYLALQEAKERIEASGVNVKQAEENYRVTEAKFKEGLATNTDLLDANTLLTRAKTDYINTLADYKIALASLRKAIGGTTSIIQFSKQ